MKQVPILYGRLSKFLFKNNFIKGSVDTTLCLKRKKIDLLIVQIYVDDIIFGATNKIFCQKITKLMQEKFEMSMMEELNFYLDLQIKQTKERIFINQAKYIKKILKKFGIESMKAIEISMSPTCKLNKDENGKSIDQKLYRDIIRSLFYLTISRPDIIFSICICARFQSNLKESHIFAVKRIFNYLMGTQNLGLCILNIHLLI